MKNYQIVYAPLGLVVYGPARKSDCVRQLNKMNNPDLHRINKRIEVPNANEED